MFRLELIAVRVPRRNSQKEGGEACAADTLRWGIGRLRRRKVQVVGIESLLEAVGIKVRSHAECVSSVGLGEIALPLPNVGHDGWAAALLEGRNVTAVAEINRIEVAVPGAFHERTREAVVVSTRFDERLRYGLGKQRGVCGESVVASELHGQDRRGAESMVPRNAVLIGMVGV